MTVVCVFVLVLILERVRPFKMPDPDSSATLLMTAKVKSKGRSIRKNLTAFNRNTELS